MSPPNFGYCAGNIADAKAQKNGYGLSATGWARQGTPSRGWVCTKVNGFQR